MSTKKKVIKYLLSEDREFDNGVIKVHIGRDNFKTSNINHLGEKEFINILSLLETEGLIHVHFRGNSKDLSCFITIFLYEPVINYFNKKRSKIFHNFIEVVKWLIPTIISLISLAIAILSYIHTLQLQQLVK